MLSSERLFICDCCLWTVQDNRSHLYGEHQSKPAVLTVLVPGVETPLFVKEVKWTKWFM